MSSVELTCTEGGAEKFWACKVEGKKTIVTFGKMGTSGSKAEKMHKNEDTAEAFLQKMKAEKEKKGYKGKETSRAAAPASAAKRKVEEPDGGEEPAKKRVAAGGSSSSCAPAPRLEKGKSTELIEKAKAAADRTDRKGGDVVRAVDPQVPNCDEYSVHEDFSVVLNQTHMEGGKNNNKYYMIQVLEKGGKYYSWNRWGRVGDAGKNSLAPSAGLEHATKDFEKKFREKTSNPWANRDKFEPKKDKYHIVETDASSGGSGDAPVGKLTESQIGKGQKVLEKLEAALQKPKFDKAAVELLSSDYYTLVPHDFGWSRPPAINNDDALQKEMELLKFYLRMGFEEVDEDSGVSPISGVLELPCPQTLKEAAGKVAKADSIATCDKQAIELAKKQAGNPEKIMDAVLYACIMLYTSNAIYKDLNQCLRDENRSKVKRYFNYLRLFFEAMDHLPKQKRKLWRGLSVDLLANSQYEVGNTVTWWGVSSLTADANVAKNFAKGCGGKCSVVTIEAETACDISAVTFYSHEKESLLCPGTQLKVLSRKRVGNVCEITMKEVGRAIQ